MHRGDPTRLQNVTLRIEARRLVADVRLNLNSFFKGANRFPVRSGQETNVLFPPPPKTEIQTATRPQPETGLVLCPFASVAGPSEFVERASPTPVRNGRIKAPPWRLPSEGERP